MKNKTIYIIIAALIFCFILLNSVAEAKHRSIFNPSYEDIVINVYNDTCFESSNYLYVHHEDNFNLSINQSIQVRELKQLGNKSVFAKIKTLN